MNKYNISTDFYNRFVKLTEAQKENFSRICNRILNANFIMKRKAADNSDYYFIIEHFTIFQSYFALMDYSLIHYESDSIITINTDLDRNRIRLKKVESVMLLVLRYLYHQKLKEINQFDKIMVSIGDIHNEIEKTNIYGSRLRITELESSLRLLKRFNIIDFISTNFANDDTQIEIYPSILYVVKIEDIKDLTTKLKSYKLEVDEDDETEED
jgi:hypothetical protein